MDEVGIKNLIFTSSVAIYGLNKNTPSENSNPEPFNHYGKSKWQAEQAIKNWYNDDPEGKSVTILRPTVIFGEGNRGNVYKLLKQISSGKFLMIGSGQNKKSMAYVGNVTSFINNRLDKTDLGYKVFNYCDKPDFNMLELVSIIENKINLKIPRFKIPYRLVRILDIYMTFRLTCQRKTIQIDMSEFNSFVLQLNLMHLNYAKYLSLRIQLEKR